MCNVLPMVSRDIVDSNNSQKSPNISIKIWGVFYEFVVWKKTELSRCRIMLNIV